MARFCRSNAVFSRVANLFVPRDAERSFEGPYVVISPSQTQRPRAQHCLLQGLTFLQQDHPILRYSQAKVGSLQSLIWTHVKIGYALLSN